MEHAVEPKKYAGQRFGQTPRSNGAPVEDSPLHPVLQLQQEIGNQAVQGLLRSGRIRAKLAISQPDDPEEREADQVANTVMRKAAGTSHSEGEEMCQESGQGEAFTGIKRRASPSSAPAHVPRVVSDLIHSPGHPLDPATRSFFEPRFGRDFSDVRVHTDSEAGDSARNLNALAYTATDHIVFAPGQYSPSSAEGQRLIAHELAHVVRSEEPSADRTTCVQRQSDAGAAAPVTVSTASSGGSVVDQLRAAITRPNPDPEGAGVGDFPEAFRILNGLAMFDMLNQLDALQATGEVEVLNAHVTEAVGVGVNRIRTALATVRMAHSGVSTNLEALMELSRGTQSLPPDQQADILNYVKHVGGTAQESLVALVSGAHPEDAAMSLYLGAKSEELRTVDTQLSAANPQTEKERAALEPALENAVRLSALGLMASHRATIEDARDRLEGKNRYRALGEAPPESTPSVLAQMREAAGLVSNLQEIMGRLENYRNELYGARTRAIFHRGKVGDVLEIIANNGAEFMDEKLRDGLREGWASIRQPGDYWLWTFGASDALIRLRDEQIAGIRLAISEVYKQFPLFSELDPSKVKSGELSSDDALLQASREAYQRVLVKIDDAIANIASGGIHPFDMPKAVEGVRTAKPAPVQQALKEAVERHEVKRFWAGMGLTALEVLLCFIPVVGPTLALTVGAVALGMTVSDMLDRLTVARSSTDPYDNPVGVQSPSAFEWTMVGVAGILMAFGGAGIVRSAMRGFRAFETLGRLAPELGAGSRMKLARLMVKQPELLAAPRTTGALETELRAAGLELSTAELQGLRAASYEAAGLPIPKSSAEGLEDFLDDIWKDRESILKQGRQRTAAGRDPSKPVYDVYSKPTGPNPLKMSNEAYLAKVRKLQSGRPPGAVSNTQGADAINTFYRFQRAGFDPTKVTQRIYLNVTADQAPDVMELVIRNIVDDPAIPGVEMAKLSGPGAVSGRADAIVIYLRDADAVEKALARIRTFQGTNAQAFQAGGPALTEEVMPGVSVAEEPAPMHGGASFGQVRSQAVYKALEEAMAAGETREQFGLRVRSILQAAGVNPDAPHLNLPGPVGQSAPPPGTSGGLPGTPALLAGQGSRDKQ